VSAVRAENARLPKAETQAAHMSEEFGFLRLHIQWHRNRGTDKRYVYTFLADRPIRHLKNRIRALTNRTSQRNPREVLIGLDRIMRGWADCFKETVRVTGMSPPRTGPHGTPDETRSCNAPWPGVNRSDFPAGVSVAGDQSAPGLEPT
jgi:hypothetical protein